MQKGRLTSRYFLFGLQAIAYAGLAAEHLIWGSLTHSLLPQTLGWISIAFVGYGLSLWFGERDGGIPMSIVWAGAVLFRALLLITEPTLSSDVYRYLWDGHVANNGVSPYAYPIDSTQLDWLDTAVRGLANHTWMASPYLPAAQGLFGAITALLPLHPFSMQLSMVLIDIVNGVLIYSLLSCAGLPQHRALIYLWNPLVIVEVAHGAHVDTWLIALTLGALWLALAPGEDVERERLFAIKSPSAHRIRIHAAPILLALATLTKILPAFLLCVFFWPWRWRRLSLYMVVVAALLIAAGSRAGWGLSGELDGHGLFGALRIYADRWNYNSGLFHWLEEFFSSNGVMGWDDQVANRWAKRSAGLLLLAVLGVTWLVSRHSRTSREALRLSTVPVVAYVLLTATMHPWYLLFLLALLPFLSPAEDESTMQWLWLLPWLYLSAALFLSYLTYLNPEDLREHEWIRRTEWLPTIGLLCTAVLAWGWSKRSKARGELFPLSS